jgi:hypothetical protein
MRAESRPPSGLLHVDERTVVVKSLEAVKEQIVKAMHSHAGA